MDESQIHLRIRSFFFVLASAATVIGFGVQLLSGHPLWAVILMLLGISYLLFEANFNPWSLQNIPGMFRLLFTLIVGCVLFGLYARPILKYFEVAEPRNGTIASTKPETTADKSSAPQPQQGSSPVRTYLVSDTGAVRFPPRLDYYGNPIADQNPRVGENLYFNFYYHTVGPNPIKMTLLARKISIQPNSEEITQAKVVADFKKQVAKELTKVKTGPPHSFGPDESAYETAVLWDEKGKEKVTLTQEDLSPPREENSVCNCRDQLSR